MFVLYWKIRVSWITNRQDNKNGLGKLPRPFLLFKGLNSGYFIAQNEQMNVVRALVSEY